MRKFLWMFQFYFPKFPVVLFFVQLSYQYFVYLPKTSLFANLGSFNKSKSLADFFLIKKFLTNRNFPISISYTLGKTLFPFAGLNPTLLPVFDTPFATIHNEKFLMQKT